MSTLALQRCLHHAAREAVARCPECARFFCRECIVEHEDRVLCAGCLARLTTVPPVALRRGRSVTPLVGAGAGLFVAWLAFYFLGRMLLAVPGDFHASKIWKSDWLRSDTGDTP